MEEMVKAHIEMQGVNSKQCTKCKTVYPYSMFRKDRCNKDGLSCWCKPCKCKCGTAYRLAHLDEEAQRYKSWRERNKEYKTNQDRRYRIDNIDKIKAQKCSEIGKVVKQKSDRKYYLKIVSTPSLKIKTYLKCYAATNVKKVTFCKQNSTFKKLCGYDVLELRQHLESLFTKHMSWDNYGRGGWNIDHIKPQVLFDFDDTEQIKRCWDLSNIRPLWAIDNLKKGVKYEEA